MSMIFSFRRYIRVPIIFKEVIENKIVSLKSSAKKNSKTNRFVNRLSKGMMIMTPIAILFFSNKAYCENGENSDKTPGKAKDPVEKIIEKVFPLVAPLGFGGIFGFASGYALKRLGEKVAYAVGLAFLGLQGLSYAGYINIDYRKIANDAKKAIDADNDGEITANDFIVMWRKLKDILTFHLPGGAGFSAGFALGLYAA